MSGLFEFRPIVCPTCEVDDTRVRGRRGGAAHRDGAGELSTIVECSRCGLIYPNPFPFPKDLDALYSGTEDFFAIHANPETKTIERESLILEIEQLTKGRRLLDVGTGLGETVAAGLRRGWDAYGIESSARFATQAQQRCPRRIFHGVIENAPREIVEHAYDAVVLAAVLEHLHTPSLVLAAISRLLKPGGVLFVDVPNDAGLYFGLGNLWLKLRGKDWVVHLSPTFSPYHVYGFSKRSLSALLRKHRLEPVLWKFYAGCSVLPLRRSLAGVLEWTGSHLVHAIGRFGRLGTYLECYARKRDV